MLFCVRWHFICRCLQRCSGTVFHLEQCVGKDTKGTSSPSSHHSYRAMAKQPAWIKQGISRGDQFCQQLWRHGLPFLNLQREKETLCVFNLNFVFMTFEACLCIFLFLLHSTGSLAKFLSTPKQPQLLGQQFLFSAYFNPLQ